MTEEERTRLLAWRKENGRPWHTPPHKLISGRHHFHLTAACYEHAPIVGRTLERMDRFSSSLLQIISESNARTVAWCVLPNHYHLLVECSEIASLLTAIGKFHGRTSFEWNATDKARGRQVFHGLIERLIRSERHLFATLNYVHHNPVHHGYVERWNDWSWSSAAEYLRKAGRDEAVRVWKEYPVNQYGKGWDDPNL